MAIEVDRASTEVAGAYRSARLEPALQRMRASLRVPASASIRAVDRWSVEMERKPALEMAREQERAMEKAIEEVSSVQREMLSRVGDMRAAAMHLRESAASLARGVHVEESEEAVSAMRRAHNLRAYGNWGTGE